ncbi:MAG: hypothetical protein R3B99_10480 [Polyangiales bacterium]
MADTPELGRLERFALRYLERAYGRVPARVDDAVHVLDTEERAQLRRIELGVVFRAALIGAFTAAIGAVVEIEATALLGDDPDAATFDQQLLFWAIVGPTVGVTAVLEIALLYWDGLRSVHRLAVAAGLPLFGAQDEPRTTALALARAALELPNPRTAHGIDAHREASKLWLASVGLLYKAKVGLTAFLAKALIRRAAGRSLLRAWLVWVAVPVTAFWDAVVAWRVIREAASRARPFGRGRARRGALSARRIPRRAQRRRARRRAHGGGRQHREHPRPTPEPPGAARRDRSRARPRAGGCSARRHWALSRAFRGALGG